MKRMARKAILLVVLTAFAICWIFLMNLGSASPGAAQPGSATGPDGSTASVTLIDADSAFPTINAHVLVRDKTGQPVRGLRQDVFELTEDGIPVDITDFLSAGQQAVTAVLVIDHSGSMDRDGKMEGAREAAKVFVSMARDDMDSLGILVFNHDIDTLSPWKRVNRTDKDVLTRQIDAVSADGGTAFHDAVYAAVEQLQGASGRTVVIALTDGIDENSSRSVDQAIALARDNHVPVYTIGLGSKGDIDAGRLGKLAQETGGEFHQTPTPEELAALYRKIAQELQNEYVLSYTSPTPDMDGTQREVVVNMEHGGGTLSASRPYAVGGIIKSSINYPFFGALLLLLLVLITLPGAARRVYARPPSPEAVVPAAPKPAPGAEPGTAIADTPAPPQPSPAPPAEAPSVVQPPSPAPQPVAPTAVASLQTRPEVPPEFVEGPSRSAAPPSTAVAGLQTAPPRLITHFVITQANVTLGSGEGNDIAIPTPTVAAHHARIEMESGRYVITDTSATLSTSRSQGHTAVSFSGDPAQLRPSARNALKDGSLVKLGEAILVFRQPAQGSPPQPSSGQAWLEMAYEVTKGITTVGSEAGNDIVLTHPSVSPRHAELRQEAGRWVVYDLASAQGTFVSYSGEPAQERQISTNALKNGSTVRFGQVTFIFGAE